MNKLRLIFVFLAFLDFVFAADQVNDLSYGLIIKSSPTPDTDKTSLVLENNSPIKLGKEMTLSFQLLARDEYMFGLVSRIVTNQNENIDLTFTSTGTIRHPVVVVNEIAYPVSKSITIGEWIPVSITFHKAKNEIVLNYADESVSIPYELSHTSDLHISFGTSSFRSFKSADNASVNIRDVKIFSNGALKRYWKLKEHLQDLVLDSVARVPAVAVNPEWLIDIYSSWKKIYSDELPFNTQVAFDAKGVFYIISPNSRTINVFDTKDRSKRLINVKNGYLVSTSPNTVFYDALKNQLVSYNLRDASLSRYSFESNEWSSLSGSTTDPYLNNSSVYDSLHQTLYSFGGYEYYKYSQSLVKMNVTNGEEKRIELMNIHPRFSASTAIVGNTMYIFGGRGSKTGKQEISPRNYYDFYSVDLLTEQTVKLWELDSIADDFLPGENMVHDAERKCFYVFTSEEGGQLIQIEPDKKGFQPVSFPVGEYIEARYLYTNLYYDASQLKLFALIYQQKTKTEVIISIYSLDYPPVSIQNLTQILDHHSPSTLAIWLKIIGVVCLVVSGTICFLWYHTRRKQVTKATRNKKDIEPGTQYYDFSKSSICLLNNLKVLDIDGNNITEQFSTTMKNMLILLILSTMKDKNGIAGNKMMHLLWFGKTEESAKNIQYVYKSKLRSILKKVGHIEIKSKNGYWTIDLGNNVLCDYTEAIHLLASLKTSDLYDQEQTNRLLELLLGGVLLPDMEIDWLDAFKSDFSNLTIDILTKLIHEKEPHQLSDALWLKIADTLFLHDLINEDALYIKCAILFQSGKKGIAKSVYDNFCKEYRNLLGVDYKYSLTEVLEGK